MCFLKNWRNNLSFDKEYLKKCAEKELELTRFDLYYPTVLIEEIDKDSP